MDLKGYLIKLYEVWVSHKSQYMYFSLNSFNIGNVNYFLLVENLDGNGFSSYFVRGHSNLSERTLSYGLTEYISPNFNLLVSHSKNKINQMGACQNRGD